MTSALLSIFHPVSIVFEQGHEERDPVLLPLSNR